MLRAGLIGCGRAGLRRLAGLAADANLKIEFLCDCNSDALARAVDSLPHRPALEAQVQEALAKHCPEVVVISTPPAFHQQQAEASIAVGARHILVEKPVTCTAAGARRLEQLARQHDVHIKVGSNLRCFQEVRDLAKMLEEGSLGRITRVEFSIGHDGSNLPEWGRNPALAGGGTLLDNGVHIVDLALLLGLLPRDPTVQAQAVWLRPGVDIEMNWSAAGDGPECVFASSWQKTDGIYLSASVTGDDGVAKLIVGRPESSLRASCKTGEHEVIYGKPADSWLADTTEFLRQARSGGAAGATIAQAAAAVDHIEQVYLAAKSGGGS